jgi:TolB-like protein
MRAHFSVSASVAMLLSLLFGTAWTVSAQTVDLKEGVDRLATQLAASAPPGRTLRVAVADMPNLEGATCNLGRYIAERLTTRLSGQSQKFRVIERRRLGQVLGELKFNMSDLVDPAKAKQLGRMLGVEALVVGTISALGNTTDIDARIIEIETNNVLPGVTVAISTDDTVKRLATECQTATVRSAPDGPGGGAQRSPQEPKRLWTSQMFSLELVSIERAGSGLRMTPLYKNLRDGQVWDVLYGAGSAVARDAPQMNANNYMVDDQGNRYKLVSGSEIFSRGVTFPPGVAVREWIVFEAPQAGASEVNVFLRFNQVGPAIFKNLRVPQ